MERRKFIQQSSLFGVSLLAFPYFKAERLEITVQQITSGPNSHWFGYYDKQQIDPTGRYVLGMEVDFQYRSPNENDMLKIGIIDLKNNNEWREIGSTKAWGWQQGCMLQWIPGSGEEVIWNDIKGDQFISKVLNIRTGKMRNLPMAIYTVSSDGKFAMCTDFARIDNMRMGYGYKGGEDLFNQQKAPEAGGIHRMDLITGETKLVISLNQISKIPHLNASVEEKWHYFNHLLISPDSKRFIFLNRFKDFYITPEMKAEENAYDKYVAGKYLTRMYTANIDGSDLFELDPSGSTSHFIWRDPNHVLAWTTYQEDKGFFLFQDKTRKVTWVGKDVLTENGHQTYLPNTNNTWILNDTYPDRDRNQTLYLFHIPTGKKVILGRFYQPPESTKEWRCDLHPRFSPDGRMVIFDSTHNGDGRQMYMIDIRSIIDG